LAIDTKVDHRTTFGALGVSVKVKFGVGKVKNYERRYVEFVGRRLDNVKYVVHNNSHINVMRALIERVYKVEETVGGVKMLVDPPQPRRAFFFASMQQFKNRVCQEIAPVSRMSLEKFVETSPAPKVKIYRHAYVDFILKGLEPSSSIVTSFIKAEKVRVKDSKPDPVPRIIQPRGVKFNLIFGCYMRPLEKAMYKAIDKVFGRPTVVCGQNAEQQGKMLRDAWDEILDPIALSVDISRFDQHKSDVALSWGHSIYKYVFRNDTQLKRLKWCLSRMIDNVGQIFTSDETGRRVKVTYKKRGNTMSGDMDTSLGNKMTMCGLAYSYFIDYLGFKSRVDFNKVNNGDDAVLILSRDAKKRYDEMTAGQYRTDLLVVDPGGQANGPARRVMVAGPPKDDIKTWFRKMGFTLKIDGIVDKFEKIEFCQTQPCFIDGRWIMVRRLDALSKDCYCLKNIDLAERWLRQVKAGGKACYGSVPIFGAFYDSMPGPDVEFKRDELYGSGMYFLANKMSSTGVITPANRVSFYNTFGVTPREQEVIEETYRNMVYGTPEPQQVGLTLPLPV
jgi:hypothetical protein